IGQQPVPRGQTYQLVLNAQGRLTTDQQFGDIIVKVGQDGRYVRLRQLVRDPELGPSGQPVPGTKGIELGAQDADIGCILADAPDGKVVRYPSVALAIYQLPTANALNVANSVKKKTEELKKQFPQGVDYRVAYDTTPFVKQSVQNVVKTVFIAA